MGGNVPVLPLGTAWDWLKSNFPSKEAIGHYGLALTAPEIAQMLVDAAGNALPQSTGFSIDTSGALPNIGVNFKAPANKPMQAGPPVKPEDPKLSKAKGSDIPLTSNRTKRPEMVHTESGDRPRMTPDEIAARFRSPSQGEPELPVGEPPSVLGNPAGELSKLTALSPVAPLDLAAKRRELESVYGPEREPDPWKQFSLRLASGFVPPEQRAPFVNEATELRGSAEDYNRRRQQDIQTQLLYAQREQSEQEAAKQALQNQFALLDYQQAALQSDPLRQAQIAEIRSRAASLPLQVQLQVSELLLQAQRYADVRDDQNADRLRQAATTLVESAVRMGTSPAGMLGTVDPRVMQGGQVGTNYLMSQFPGAAAQAPAPQDMLGAAIQKALQSPNPRAELEALSKKTLGGHPLTQEQRARVLAAVPTR